MGRGSVQENQGHCKKVARVSATEFCLLPRGCCGAIFKLASFFLFACKRARAALGPVAVEPRWVACKRLRAFALASASCTLFPGTTVESNCSEKQSSSLKSRAPFFALPGAYCTANRPFSRPLKIRWNQWCFFFEKRLRLFSHSVL